MPKAILKRKKIAWFAPLNVKTFGKHIAINSVVSALEEQTNKTNIACSEKIEHLYVQFVTKMICDKMAK